MGDLALNVTPHRVGELKKAVFLASRREAGQNEIVAAQQEFIEVQDRLIKKQTSQHILDQQLHLHLNTQLINKNKPRERGGNIVKSGYGAMDAAALEAWEEEECQKKAAEEEKE